MPKVQVDLNKEQDKKVTTFKIVNQCESKAVAIKLMIDSMAISINLPVKEIKKK